MDMTPETCRSMTELRTLIDDLDGRIVELLAGALAEDLIIEGYAELKNLAGGITITAEGIQALEIPGASDGAGSAPGGLQLGDEPVLSQASKDAVEKLIHEIKARCLSDKDDYRQLEEMVFDIKTLEVQLCSSRPKTSIVREVLPAPGKERAVPL